MQQLPHKARVLEDRLYRKAPCLEAYLNRATLKNRLRKLAVTITAHYKKSVKGRRNTKRGSAGSVSTLTTDVTRDSILSNMGPPLPNGNSADSPLMSASLGTAMLGKESQPQKVVPPEVAMSELARQKAVNEELQKQILENIRQQQQLVQSIKRGSNTSHGSVNATNPNMNAAANIQGRNMADPSTMGQRNMSNNMHNGSQMNAMPGGQLNNMQGMQGMQFSNMPGNMMNRRGSDSSQSDSLRRPSAPATALPLGPNFNSSQSAMMIQQSASGMGDINGAAMQAAMLRRSSSTGNPNLGDGSGQSHAQFQAQQAALMRQSSQHSQMTNQAAAAQQAQMQAALMRQASAGSNQFNMAQAQAALMRQASNGSNQMNPQAAAQAQAVLMRQASAGSNQMNGFSSSSQQQAALMRHVSMGSNPGQPPGMLGNPGTMGQQMGPMQIASVFANNQMAVQPNPAMMQSMNAAAGMQQNMMQFSNMQQQMNMAAQGRNSMTMMGNDAKDDAGVSQNSFNW